MEKAKAVVGILRLPTVMLGSVCPWPPEPGGQSKKAWSACVMSEGKQPVNGVSVLLQAAGNLLEVPEGLWE